MESSTSPSRRPSDGETASEPTDSRLIKDASNENVVDNVEREAASSPEPNCAICLGKMENKSFTDSCFHQFCFTCLLEWSKVKAECPLCKQSFKSIVHNVRSIEDYDQYHLQTENFGNWDNGGEGSAGGMGGRRFRYRSTLTAERLREMALGRLLGRPRLSPNRHPDSPPMPARPSPYTTSEFRRYIYENDLWARSSCRASRYREAAPNFYSTNPAVTHRLVPWLNRELNALRYGHQVAFLLELIMSLIERFHIRSPEFREHIRPYFLNETDHFVHEFFNFARSPHDMVEYDRLVTYGPSSLANDDAPTNANAAASSSRFRSSADDVVVVYSSENVSRSRELVGHQPVVLTRARLFLDLVSPSRTPRNHEPTATTTAETSRNGSPVPGPSGIQNKTKITTVGVGLGFKKVKLEVTLDDDDDDDDDEDHDDDDIQVIQVIKPSNPKPPDMIIELSDDDDDDDHKEIPTRDDVIPDGDAPSTSRLASSKRSSSDVDSESDSSNSDEDDDSTIRSSSSDWNSTSKASLASSIIVLKSEPTASTSTSTSTRSEPKSHKRHKSKHRHHHHHHKHKSHSHSKSSRREHRHRRSDSGSPSSSERHKHKHHKQKGKPEKNKD